MSDVAEGLLVNRSSLQTGIAFARLLFLLSNQIVCVSVHQFTRSSSSSSSFFLTPKARNPSRSGLSATTQGCLLDLNFLLLASSSITFFHFSCWFLGETLLHNRYRDVGFGRLRVWGTVSRTALVDRMLQR